jgi:hypothetical protein
MKKTAILLLASAVLALASCAPPENAYEIELYVSLGSASTLPAGAGSQDVLTNYWGKAVRFSAVGIDAGVNDDVNLAGSESMSWTGDDPTSGTQFATHTFSLAGANGTYAGGSFTFKFYIDWDGDSTLDSGDVVMTGYSIIADKDNDPDTPGEEVTPAEYGSEIAYNAGDRSISIDDPLTYNSGFTWIVEKIHEGNLELVP